MDFSCTVAIGFSGISSSFPSARSGLPSKRSEAGAVPLPGGYGMALSKLAQYWSHVI